MGDGNHRRGGKATQRRATPVVKKRGKRHKKGVPARYLTGWLIYDTVVPNRGDAKGRKRWKRQRSRSERRNARQAADA